MAASEAPLVGALQPNRSLKAQVFESVRSAIVQGRLEGGKLYSVEALSREMNVSRTPVREALLDLAARGMVRFERSQGFRVLQMSVDDLREVLTMRLIAEVPAAFRATQLAGPADLADLQEQVAAMTELQRAGDSQQLLESDRRFHRRILEISGNQRLAEHVDRLRDLMTLHGYYSRDVQLDLNQHLADHDEIVGAMRRGDAAGAAEAAKSHVLNTGRDMLLHAGDSTGTLEWSDVVGPPRA
jgi:DNA-binding GntR family transcriptional regulator